MKDSGEDKDDWVRIPITTYVALIAAAAALDEDWPARVQSIRNPLSENTLNAIREVAKRLNDYANNEGGGR